MNVLVIGASGATGKLVVQNLLEKDINIKIVIRENATINKNLLDNNKVKIIKGNISEFTLERIKDLVNDCYAVVCCLGHNISFKGIFGPPYKLVSNSVENIIFALQSFNIKKKFILMSTTAYTNKKTGEKNTIGEKVVFSLLKLFLPPHRDNMIAGDFLVYKIGSQNIIDWIAVRPDSLIDENSKSNYEIFPQKISSPIFNPGKTSRINVADFMVELITNEKLWNEWNHKTPVIYNKN
ncbi:MAG: NAD(P)H-binding protein [Ignavibacteriae bacterium]|nr:NAD(P)H-binding protein [Ignavibacteriota bacterium]